MKYFRLAILILASLLFISIFFPHFPLNLSTSAHPAAPGPFNKQLPADNALNQPTSNLSLQWSASAGATSYQYCLRTNKKMCPPGQWVNAGGNLSTTLQGLTPNTTYYWQVRALDASPDRTEADNGVWWQFKTIQNQSLPGASNKLTPADTAVNQPIDNLTLTWSASANAASYEYCADTVNNNACDTTWTSVSGLSGSLSGLAYGTTYYWQVRAVNASGNVQADGGVWFSFQTQPMPPGTFGKLTPVNAATGLPLNPTLTWSASSGSGITYEYCIATAPCTSASAWIPAGTNLSANPAGLQFGTTYFWQVRAVNLTAITYADNGVSWQFTTALAPPQAFGKVSPGNNLTNQPLSLTLSWGTSAGANVTYEYCLSTVPCTPASTWLLAGASTSVDVSGLAYATTYYWQARAVNIAGITYADGGAVWNFTTQAAPPQPFSKLSPPNGSLDVPVNIVLQWSASSGASQYFYCVDTVSHPANDTACNTGWVLSAGTQSNPLSLAYNQVYYWQVYAQNSQGTLQADDGAWNSFTTGAPPPQNFTKISPANGVIDQPINPWLYWWTPGSPGATYEYCVDVDADCTGGTWNSVAENAPIYVTPALQHNTTYFWQVRAISGGVTVYANNASWFFTTLKAPPTSSDQTFTTPEDVALNETLAATSNYGKIFTLYGSQPAGTLALQSSGSFIYLPPLNFNGAVSFQFVLSDGYNPPVGPYTVTITVAAVNDAPQLSAIPDQAGVNGGLVAFFAQATDPDLPYGDHLTYSIDEALPSGASIDPATGAFTWAVSPLQGSAVFDFTVRATDSGGLSAAQPVKITITSTLLSYLPALIR